MKTAIFMLLLLAHVPNAHAATKTLNASGQGKLLAWAQKVARIYGTALKNMPSGVKKTEDLDIYIYARSADGLFTTSWYARVNYTNSNMTFTPTCMGAGTSDTQDNLHCISNLHPTAYKDYGAYASTMPVGDFGMDPYEPQTAFGSGHGACLNNRIKTINLSCLIGVRKYVSSKATTNLWAILSTKAVGTGCQASAALPVSLSPVSSISCATKAALNNIKSKLKDYKTYLGTCNNGVLPAAMNIDLTELEEVLNDMQNGYLLADGDITQEDTYPPAARNPWTFTNPTLATEGNTSQTHLVGNVLPDKFKVRVTDAAGVVPVVFSVTPPDGGWTFIPEGGQAVTRNTVNGIAETGFKLGSVSGTYPIKATCAECCPGEVAFSATALTNAQATELQAVPPCDGSNLISTELPNPFVVRAYNTYSHVHVTGAPVEYKIISQPSGASGATPALENTTTADYGLAQYRLKLGNTPGDYLVRARCTTCLANQDVICRGHAAPKEKREFVEALNKIESTNPNEINPATGKPRNPILRIINVAYPNDFVSFTTAPGENTVRAIAEILPKDYYSGYKSQISWKIEDAPDDPLPSGDPEDPAFPGETADFNINVNQQAVYDGHNVPKAPTGRTHPLRYKLSAQVITPDGTFASVPRMIRQDEIDKCRQEYIDFGIPLIDASRPLIEVSRGVFTVGKDGLGTPLDCYAHIFPRERYDEVVNLRKTYTIQVNSGYRSPRANKYVAGSKSLKSWHLFGRAIDIEVLPETPLNYYSLWSKVQNPKLLENSSGFLVKRDSSGKLIIGDDTGGYPVPLVFYQSGWMHLGE